MHGDAQRPTQILRLVHIDNLPVLLRRGGLHAPNHVPNDGLAYRTIHNVEIQRERHARQIPCGPGGTLHDYVPFYFGPHSPMLLQLKTGQVEGYDEGQEPLLYLATTAQTVAESGVGYVFSDGHGIKKITGWFDDLGQLDKVDWDVARAKQWNDTLDDPDRKRRKQAEFLVHRFCAWGLLQGIGVIDEPTAARVAGILDEIATTPRPVVKVKRGWYN